MTPHFRIGSSDKNIWAEIYDGNSYRLEQFNKGDVVVDVGAHIGAFTCACLQRGARTIIACEPHPENYELLQHHVHQACGELGAEIPALHQKSVWRSDRPENLWLTPHGHSGPETPAPGVAHYEGPTTWPEANPDSIPVTSVSLDALLQPHPKIDLLKLDCEGAEWPILFTSQRLGDIQRLIIEVHSLDWKTHDMHRAPVNSLCAEFGHYSLADLKRLLQAAGLHCWASHTWCPNDHPAHYAALMDWRREAIIPARASLGSSRRSLILR